MLRALTASVFVVGVLGSAAWADPSSYYNIQDYASGAGSNGAYVGTHHVSGPDGAITAILAGGGDPSVEVKGSSVDGVSAYLYGRADYDYHITLTSSDPAVGAALARLAASNGSNLIIGDLSANLRVASTLNSMAMSSLSASGKGGVDNIYASCAGYFCYSAAPGFASGALVPITLAVHLSDFDFGCATNPNTGVLEGDCSSATTKVGLRVSASLYNGPGLSAGSVDAYLDPTFAFNPDFLSANGINPTSLTITQDSVSSVPEPAGWALMLVGFALLGGALRRSAAVRA